MGWYTCTLTSSGTNLTIILPSTGGASSKEEAYCSDTVFDRKKNSSYGVWNGEILAYFYVRVPKVFFIFFLLQIQVRM